jgi:hypothetical protein
MVWYTSAYKIYVDPGPNSLHDYTSLCLFMTHCVTSFLAHSFKASPFSNSATSENLLITIELRPVTWPSGRQSVLTAPFK